ncbi:uncharacterized protein LOC133184879 [Saccostrea echinata]|uniref:uncharacterized protein LOC133184879 n=1 Tax=Saccostrea echinata TaxID=191078 RepID=UPI002A835307|nr:uncharacterized protein LOC133184879 [Saccostrea echinata]
MSVMVECLPGYFGENCTSECRYPYFGQKCQEECNCSISDCNFQYGCSKATTEKHSSSTKFDFTKDFVSNTETINLTHLESVKVNNSVSVPFILIVCVGSLLSVMIIVAIIKKIVVYWFLLFAKKNTDASSDIYLDIDENLQVETGAANEKRPNDHITVRVTETPTSSNKDIDSDKESAGENIKECVYSKVSKTKMSATKRSDNTNTKEKHVNSCKTIEKISDKLEKESFGENGSQKGTLLSDQNNVKDDEGKRIFDQGAETNITVDSYIYVNKQTEITHL